MKDITKHPVWPVAVGDESGVTKKFYPKEPVRLPESARLVSQSRNIIIHVPIAMTLKQGEKKGYTLVRSYPKIGRNASCPCGSGKKFKQCHEKTGLITTKTELIAVPKVEIIR